MFRKYELEELGRLYEELMPKLALRDEGRIERSRWDKGAPPRCVKAKTVPVTDSWERGFQSVRSQRWMVRWA